jgi:chemotaxis protein CheD
MKVGIPTNAQVALTKSEEKSALSTSELLPESYLHPGQLHVTADAMLLKMILGSCVGVFLFDPILRIGGVAHYLLPQWDGTGVASPRYGDVALKNLLLRMNELGARTTNLQAKIFGGACTLSFFRENGQHVGTRNVRFAEAFLGETGIRIIFKDVLGETGRKIIIRSDTGAVSVARIEHARTN